MSVPTISNSPSAAAAAANGFTSGLGDAQNGGIVTTTATTTPTSTGTPSAPNVRTFTAEDIERARSQEKDKLYPLIEELRGKVSVFEQERNARLEAERQAKEAEDAKKRQQADEETDLRTLLAKKDEEWTQRLEEERRQRETALALLEQERNLQEIETYRQQAIRAAGDSIIPDLIDYVSGNTKDEIDASIAGLAERSSRILNAAQAAQAQVRQNMVGTRVTVPSAGPLDTNSAPRQFTPEEIRNMSVSEYGKVRGTLLGGRSPRDKGLFG